MAFSPISSALRAGGNCTFRESRWRREVHNLFANDDLARARKLGASLSSNRTGAPMRRPVLPAMVFCPCPSMTTRRADTAVVAVPLVMDEDSGAFVHLPRRQTSAIRIFVRHSGPGTAHRVATRSAGRSGRSPSLPGWVGASLLTAGFTRHGR